MGRGAAYADYDKDGDLDLVMTTNNGPARLFRNEGGNPKNSLRIVTVGTASNRDGIGAVVQVDVGGRVVWPSGKVDRLPALDANQTIVVHEGKGIVNRLPLRRPIR